MLLNAALLLAALPASAGTRLQLLTYNAAGIPWVQRLAGERIRTLAHNLEHYDVVALQEVWTPFEFQTLKRESGFPYALRREDLPVGNGLALLSRVPVVQWRFYAFTGRAAFLGLFSGDADAVSHKGVLAARLRTEKGEELDVYDTHLLSDESGWDAREVRLSQLLELDAAIRDFSQGRPFVLLGDLNAPAGGEQASLAEALLGVGDACRPGGQEACGPTFSDARLDYVLGPARGARLTFDRPLPVRGTFMRLSDHTAGVTASVELPLAPPRPSVEARRSALETIRAALQAGRRQAGWFPAWRHGLSPAGFDAALALAARQLASLSNWYNRPRCIP